MIMPRRATTASPQESLPRSLSATGGSKTACIGSRSRVSLRDPIGPAIAAAAAEGYTGSGPAAYHGYFYKLLKEQGPDAEGGAKSYLVDGKLSGGFALLAYPANYGNSGIMTFIVNQDGNIFQKDLGDDTVNVARQITVYNPGQDWEPAQ